MTTARDLTVRLADLLRSEHDAMADFLVALADFDRRRLWLDLGYSGLFPFLHRELGLSKAAAYFRKTAADLVRCFPEVVGPLRDGRLCLTAVVELARVVTAENRAEVLPRFFHCSKKEARAVAAAIAPEVAPPRREVVTAVRAEPSPERTVRPDEPTNSEGGCAAARPVLPAVSPGVSSRRAEVEPLTAELRRFHVTVSRRFLDKLDAARAALSHARPGASAEDVLEAGLDLVLERHAKRRGMVKRPQENVRPAAPEHVPAHVKRAVWARDGGRCQWPIASGGICGSTLRVELDHVVPRARGGPPTVEGLRLLCRMHNDPSARRVFGDGWMDRFTRGAPGWGRGLRTRRKAGGERTAQAAANARLRVRVSALVPPCHGGPGNHRVRLAPQPNGARRRTWWRRQKSEIAQRSTWIRGATWALGPSESARNRGGTPPGGIPAPAALSSWGSP